MNLIQTGKNITKLASDGHGSTGKESCPPWSESAGTFGPHDLLFWEAEVNCERNELIIFKVHRFGLECIKNCAR